MALFPGMSSLWRNLRAAVRSLSRDRSVAVLAIAALALGIGATTAIFSVIDNVLLEPFPYTDSHRLVTIEIHDSSRSDPGGRTGFRVPEFLDYQAQNHVFDRVIGNCNLNVLYDNGEGTEQFNGVLVVPNTFEFLGMPALLGRVMEPADYMPGAPPVFVLRYKVWVSRFNADPGILGRTFILNGVSRTLVGIMPQRFGWGDADLWIPTSLNRADEVAAGQFPNYFWMLGHLRPGVTLRQAQADIDLIAHRLAPVYPKEYPKQFTIHIQTLADTVVGQFRVMLFIVMGAVSMLLLIACANVANLLLARATAREKEIAIRAAIGAGRWRIVRQLLTESLLLGVCGAAFGCLLAWGGIKGLIAIVPAQIIPAEAYIHINISVLLFALVTGLVTALVFGTVPAVQLTRQDLNEVLRDTGKGVSGGFRHRGLRNGLIVGEVALSLALLTGAGLLMRSFFALQEVPLGADPSHVLVAVLPMPPARYQSAAQIQGFFRPLLERVKATPGVEAATEATSLPPFGGFVSKLEIPGKAAAEDWRSQVELCSEGYFATLHIKLLRGRTFNESEVNAARKLAVVNQTFAKKFLGDNWLGQSATLPDLATPTFPDPMKEPTFEIIGVVADVKNQGLDRPVLPEVWVPYDVMGGAFRGILVRTTGDPKMMLNTLRREIWAVDRGVALGFNGTNEDFISQFAMAQPRFGLYLIAVFAIAGLVLVLIGVYGVVAYAVTRQRHEIGIRMALGASTAMVLRMVLSLGLRLMAMGAGVGLLASFGLSRILASQLFGISTFDPVTVAGVIVLVFIAGIAACLLPARSATRVDPMIALRYE
ncbi:MAG TPA: ABC transporter permease [Bryobacteraceae bacterium]|nr:ABC transporter permease [Bryobacteraceae bacterium]